MIEKLCVRWTSSPKDILAWDQFVRDNPRGHCQQLSYWLDSFQAYGGNYEILIVKDKGNIVAGIGVIHIGISFLKVTIASGGPVIDKCQKELFDPIIKLFLARAKFKKSFYCHINAPVLQELDNSLSNYCLYDVPKDSILYQGKLGNKFSSITCINGLRPVFINYDTKENVYELIVNKFNSNTKRNIKQSLKNDLEIRFVKSEIEIEKAYEIIVETSKYHNYNVRTWDDSKKMLLSMVEDEFCIIPCCFTRGKLIGALILFEVGQRLTYVSGGILRGSQDLKVGHFLQNEMLKYSIKKGYSFYDISVIGGDGVTRFKEGFRGYHVKFIGNRYWINSKFKFALYRVLIPFLSKNKQFISRIKKLFLVSI